MAAGPPAAALHIEASRESGDGSGKIDEVLRERKEEGSLEHTTQQNDRQSVLSEADEITNSNKEQNLDANKSLGKPMRNFIAMTFFARLLLICVSSRLSLRI